VRIGKNVKITVAAERIIARFLKGGGGVTLETVGAGAVNQAVKAVARAREALEPEGYALVIIPQIVQVPLGHGHQTVVHLTVIDWYGGRD